MPDTTALWLSLDTCSYRLYFKSPVKKVNVEDWTVWEIESKRDRGGVGEKKGRGGESEKEREIERTATQEVMFPHLSTSMS